MAPLYVHCPKCEFPVVVRYADRALVRHCRQCRCRYRPEEEKTPKAQLRSPLDPVKRHRPVLRELFGKRERRAI